MNGKVTTTSVVLTVSWNWKNEMKFYECNVIHKCSIVSNLQALLSCTFKLISTEVTLIEKYKGQSLSSVSKAKL